MALIAALGAGAVAVAVLTDAPPRMTAEALVRSVQHEVGPAPVADGSCTQRGSLVWSCLVDDAEGSGAASYRVRTTPNGCWTARLRRDVSTRSMPLLAAGCLD